MRVALLLQLPGLVPMTPYSSAQAAQLLTPSFTAPLPLRSPTIVGVSKRWWRVCWGSKALWRHLDVSDIEREALIRTTACTWWPFFQAKQAPFERRQLRWQAWQAAQRSQLERIGGLAEAVSFSGQPAQLLNPPTGLLPLLSPQSLADLSLVTCQLDSEGVSTLAGFTRLTSLAIVAEHDDCPHVAPMLPKLARLQCLELRANRTCVQLAHLLPLTGLTSLVSEADGRLALCRLANCPALLAQVSHPQSTGDLLTYQLTRGQRIGRGVLMGNSHHTPMPLYRSPAAH